MNPQLIDLIKNVGFPICVAIFLLWKVDYRLGKLEKSLGEFMILIKVYLKNCDRGPQ